MKFISVPSRNGSNIKNDEQNYTQAFSFFFRFAIGFIFILWMLLLFFDGRRLYTAIGNQKAKLKRSSDPRERIN